MSFRVALRFVVLFSFAFVPLVASAQQKGATVQGTVADPDEAVIPGATVTLTPASGKAMEPMCCTMCRLVPIPRL
jgi:hypothetical protein